MNDQPAAPGLETDHDLAVGKKIRMWRERRGMSRRELGERLKTSTGQPVKEQQVYRWETGRDTPQRWRWQEIADALSVEPGTIFGEPENPQLLIRLDLTERRVDAIVRILGLGDAVDAAVAGQRRSKADAGAEAQRIAREAEQEAQVEESELERELAADDPLADSSEQPGEGSEPGSENR